MASQERIGKLKDLVSQAGGFREAELLIHKVKKCAPTKSSIHRASQGVGTDYVVQCYIDDLTKALKAEAIPA